MPGRSNPVISEKVRPIGISRLPRSPEPETQSPVFELGVFLFHFPGDKMAMTSDNFVLGEAGR